MVAYLRIAPNLQFNQALTMGSAKSAHRFGCVSPGRVGQNAFVQAFRPRAARFAQEAFESLLCVWRKRVGRPHFDREPERAAMPISDMPIFSMLRTKMHWHQERQRLLAENVANADTPKFAPRDLVPLNFDQTRAPTGSLALARTDPGHIGDSAGGGSSRFRFDRKFDFESRPSGNAVGLEDEM